MVQIGIKLLSNDKLLIPERKNSGDAGFDLKAAHDEIIESKTVKLIKTGISVEIPIGYEGQVRSRSGLALKANAFVLNSPGTIDSGYRGEVGVILANLSNEKLVIQKYDRVAQLVINQLPEVILMPVENLSDTERGAGGFGSTGI
jgi:dUTP pyrophosphatase